MLNFLFSHLSCWISSKIFADDFCLFPLNNLPCQSAKSSKYMCPVGATLYIKLVKLNKFPIILLHYGEYRCFSA